MLRQSTLVLFGLLCEGANDDVSRSPAMRGTQENRFSVGSVLEDLRGRVGGRSLLELRARSIEPFFFRGGVSPALKPPPHQSPCLATPSIVPPPHRHVHCCCRACPRGLRL